MKRSLSLFAFLVLSFLSASAQSVSFEWSTTHPQKHFYSKEYPFYSDSSGHYFIRLKEKRSVTGPHFVYIDKYNKQRERIPLYTKLKLQNPQGFRCELLGVIHTGDSIMVLMTRHKFFVNTLYAWFLGTDGKPGRCVTLDTIRHQPIPNLSLSYGFTYMRGQDRLLIYAKNNSPSNEGILRAKVFDLRLKQEWSANESLAGLGKLSLSDYVITEDGSAYTVAYTENGTKLCGFNTSTQQFVQKALRFDNTPFISGLKMHVENGNLYIAAYGGPDKKESDGICLMVINLTTMQTTFDKKVTFDARALIRIIGEKLASQGKKMPPTFFIHQVIPCEDGSVIVVGENGYIYSPNGIQSRYCMKENITVTKIDKDGNLAWNHVIRKKDEGLPSLKRVEHYAPEEPAYLLAMAHGNIYILHEDMEANREGGLGKKIEVFNEKKGRITLVTINAEGAIKRSDMGPVVDPDGKHYMDFNSFYMIDADHVLVYERKIKRSRKVGVLTLKP